MDDIVSTIEESKREVRRFPFLSLFFVQLRISSARRAFLFSSLHL
jgi:hypothetical protein